jgi:hypothetical protein
MGLSDREEASQRPATIIATRRRSFCALANRKAVAAADNSKDERR